MIRAPNAIVMFKFRLEKLKEVFNTGSKNVDDYHAALNMAFVQSGPPLMNPREAEERIESLIAIFDHLTPGFNDIKGQIIDLYADSLISNYKDAVGKNDQEKEQLAVPKRAALKEAVLNKLLFDLVSAGEKDILLPIIKKIATFQGGSGNFAAVEEYLNKEKIKAEKLVVEARLKKDPLIEAEYQELNTKRDRFIELHRFLAGQGLTEDDLAVQYGREYGELKEIERELNIRVKAARDAESKATPMREYINVERGKLNVALAKLKEEEDKLLESVDILNKKLDAAEGDVTLVDPFRLQLEITRQKIEAIGAQRTKLTVEAQINAEQKDELYLLEKMTALWQTSSKAYHQGKKKLSNANNSGAPQPLDFFAQGGDVKELLKRAKQKPVKQQGVASSSHQVIDDHENPAQAEWLKRFLEEYGQDYPEGLDALKEKISNFNRDMALIYKNAQEEKDSIRAIAANNNEKKASLNKDLEACAERYSQMVSDCVEGHSQIVRLDLRRLIAGAGAKKFLGMTNVGDRPTPFIGSDKYLSISFQILNQDIILKKMMMDALKVPVAPVKGGIQAQKEANQRYVLEGYTKDGNLKIQFKKNERVEDEARAVGRLNAHKDSLAGLIIKVADYPLMFVVADDVDTRRFEKEVDGIRKAEIAGFKIVSESDARKYISGDLDKDGNIFVATEGNPKEDKSAQTRYSLYLDVLTGTQLNRLANFIGIDFAIYFDASSSEKVDELKSILQDKLSRSNITMADILYVALGYRMRDNDVALALEQRFKPEGYVFDADTIKGDMFFADKVTIGHKTDSALKLEDVPINKVADNTQILVDINYKNSDSEDFIRRVELLESKISPINESLEDYRAELDGLPGKLEDFEAALREINRRIPHQDPQVLLRKYLAGSNPEDFSSPEGRLELVKHFSVVATCNFDIIRLEQDAVALLETITKEIASTRNAKRLELEQAQRNEDMRRLTAEIRREIKIDLYDNEDLVENERMTARLDAAAEAEYIKRHGANVVPIVQQVAQRAERANHELQDVQRGIQLANRLGNDEELIRLRAVAGDLTREIEELRRQLATSQLLQQQRLEVAQKSPMQVFIETGGDWDKAFKHAAQVSHLDHIDLGEVQKTWINGLKIGDISRKKAFNSSAATKVAEYNDAEKRREKYGQ
ncbi:hypothetical protein CC99x_008175 [Candidatus Berkiella cookevillensis]|uniref:Uncharacterized protein n=1 Tax=Candidatus Berkiella cookevillensis TaxID=437022 RepID=A0A0Q9YTA5_9GAMM|nr:hypothetical protein [Candidatus Berkiella cookevillensis]MCS5708881.1 hypothetical protein [Candidatus Berkiella cookevillensis]